MNERTPVGFALEDVIDFETEGAAAGTERGKDSELNVRELNELRAEETFCVGKEAELSFRIDDRLGLPGMDAVGSLCFELATLRNEDSCDAPVGS